MPQLHSETFATALRRAAGFDAAAVLAVIGPASTTGPAHFIAVDPDGNPILVDQHV